MMNETGSNAVKAQVQPSSPNLINSNALDESAELMSTEITSVKKPLPSHSKGSDVPPGMIEAFQLRGKYSNLM